MHWVRVALQLSNSDALLQFSHRAQKLGQFGKSRDRAQPLIRVECRDAGNHRSRRHIPPMPLCAYTIDVLVDGQVPGDPTCPASSTLRSSTVLPASPV